MFLPCHDMRKSANLTPYLITPCIACPVFSITPSKCRCQTPNQLPDHFLTSLSLSLSRFVASFVFLCIFRFACGWLGVAIFTPLHPFQNGHLQVFAANEDGGHLLASVPPCKPLSDKSNPVLVPSNHHHDDDDDDVVVTEHNRRQLQLPADYNGWLQYTAYHNETGFDVFTSVMSVPGMQSLVRLPL